MHHICQTQNGILNDVNHTVLTEEHSNEDKDEFYGCLRSVIDRIHKHDLLLMGMLMFSKIRQPRNGKSNGEALEISTKMARDSLNYVWSQPSSCKIPCFITETCTVKWGIHQMAKKK